MPAEGKVTHVRVHLGLRVGAELVGDERVAVLDAECTWLATLGTVRVRLLIADEGNEFCLD